MNREGFCRLDLRGVGAAREHRLAEKHPADRDAVNSAGELAVHPDFDRVREAGGVQRAVGAAHRLAEPRAGVVRARRGATVEHAPQTRDRW